MSSRAHRLGSLALVAPAILIAVSAFLVPLARLIGLSFSAKAASGLGTFIAGLALGIIGFPADLAAKGGDKAHIAASTIEHLGLMYGIVPGTMTFICVILSIFYRIDRAAHARIQSELAARRGMPAVIVGEQVPLPENLP